MIDHLYKAITVVYTVANHKRVIKSIKPIASVVSQIRLTKNGKPNKRNTANTSNITITISVPFITIILLNCLLYNSKPYLYYKELAQFTAQHFITQINNKNVLQKKATRYQYLLAKFYFILFFSKRCFYNCDYLQSVYCFLDPINIKK